MRLSVIFVAVCMLLIAASGGAVVYFVLGVPQGDAAILAGAVPTALALYNRTATRLRARAQDIREVGDLARAVADVARQVVELGRHAAALEARVERSLQQPRAAPAGAEAPLAAEFEEVGTLVRQLA